MRICFVYLFYSKTSVGGIERYLDTTIKELLERGHVIDVVTSSFSENKVEKEGNLTVHSLKFMNPLFKDKIKGGKLLYFYLKKLVKNKMIDIISAENFYRTTPPSHAFAVNLVSIETKVPAVLRMHAHCEKEIEIALLKDLMWTKMIGVSKSVNNAAYNAGADIKKIVLAYPGINTKVFRPGLGKRWLRDRIHISKDDLLILHASRISGSKGSEIYYYLDIKGITTLLEAFAILAPKYKNAKLLIAAAKPPKIWQKNFEMGIKKIKDLAEIHGIKNKIILQSFELQEMPLVYNGCDIFVMASQMESFGLVYAEAMACGVATIGTSVGGVTEIIDNGVTGFLVEPKKPSELARKIEILIKDSNKREKMGEEGIKRIGYKFDSRKMVDRLVGIFNSCLEGRSKKEKSLSFFKQIAEE